MTEPTPPRSYRRAALLLLALGCAVGLAWQLTPLHHAITFETVTRWLEHWQGHPWMPLAMVAVYVLGGLLLFFHAVLLWATVFAFDPWHSIFYAELGSIASALFMYGLGRILRPDVIRRLAGSYLGTVSQALGRRGLLTVILLHWFPICPFSVLNLLAGSTHIRFTDFVIGTVVGITPGIVFLGFFGEQIRQTIHHPHVSSVAGLLAFLVLGFFVLRRSRRWLETHNKA